MYTYPSNLSLITLSRRPLIFHQVDIVDKTGKKWTFSRRTAHALPHLQHRKRTKGLQTLGYAISNKGMATQRSRNQAHDLHRQGVQRLP